MWTILRPEADEDAIGEIERQSDRGAAIVCAVFLEERLEHIIRERLVWRNKKVEERLFRNAGPLADFSSKIDVGHLLGAYNAAHHTVMHQIRRIRNKFAHSISPLSFSHESIKPLCDKLPVAKELYKSAVERDISHLPGFEKLHAAIIENFSERSEVEESPREQFINTVSMCMFEATVQHWLWEGKRRRRDS